MRQPHRVTAGKRLQALGQIPRAGHFGVVHEHRNDALAQPQSRFDLDAHEIVLVVEPAASHFILGVKPIRPNHHEEDVALIDLILQHAHEIQPRLDTVDIHEELV